MRRLLFTLTLTLVLLIPAAAYASGSAVIRDCTDDGRLEGHYTQRDLRDALSSIPSDVDEYTDCRDIIRRAAFAASAAGGGGGKGGGATSGGGGTGGGSGSSGGSAGGEFGGFGNSAPSNPNTPLSADQQKTIDAARLGGAGPVRFSDGALIKPGALARRTAEVSDVPTPLLIVALLLAAAALTAAIPSFRTRVLARRQS
jgi:hypothetical protein